MAGLQGDSAILAAESKAEHDFVDDKKRTANTDDQSSDRHSGKQSDLDGIHDGLEFPTDEERATLRRVPDKIPWPAYRQSSS
jgi:proton-dependent oligopeptide transporter, POT family